jgi:hypothetical protein
MLPLGIKMRLVNQSKLPKKRITDLETEIPEQENLKDVMKWALSNQENLFLKWSPTLLSKMSSPTMYLFPGVKGWCSFMTPPEWVALRQLPFGTMCRVPESC